MPYIYVESGNITSIKNIDNDTDSIQGQHKFDAPPTQIRISIPDDTVSVDMDKLRERLHAMISHALPEFYEYRQMGHNTLNPKKVDIQALQSQLNSTQIPTLIQPLQKLLAQAANAFLDRFKLFMEEKASHNNELEFINFRLKVIKAGWDEPQNRDYHQALKHANRLSSYLSGTLHLMGLLNYHMERQAPWENIKKTRYNSLLNELLPVDPEEHHNQYTAQIRGNLTKKHSNNIKFNAIVNSVILDERIANETLSTEIEETSARLLSGIALTKNYAGKTDENSETSRINRDIVTLCQVLQEVIHSIKYVGKQIQPWTKAQFEELQLLKQKEDPTLAATVKRKLTIARKAVSQKAQGFKSTLGTVPDKINKNTHRIAHILPRPAIFDTDTIHHTNKSVLRAGIILLDKIQQTTSGIYKARLASRPFRQAVTHYSELKRMLSDMEPNKILDAKLRAEYNRWREKAEGLKKQLQQILGEITTLAEEHKKQQFLSALRNELNHAPAPMVSNSIISEFETQVKVAVDRLDSIEKSLNQTVLRLSEHGEAGGIELDEKIVTWLQNLNAIKGQLKTSIIKATGQSINNFSCTGMLARRMGEWNETEKQRYLATLSAEGRTAAEKQYDTVFFEVIQRYLPLLSKESDPQGDEFLQRLRLEVDHAAKGTTLYPATMADILAEMKSTNPAIRDWSRRKLVRGVFLAACLEGIKLIPNLAALPLKTSIKFVITGAKVARAAYKGRQGIRGGEGDINDEVWEYASRSYTTAAIKAVLSLPPGLVTILGVTSIAWDFYEGGLIGAEGKIAKTIVGEAPWRALDIGSRALAEAYVTILIDAAITEKEITSVSHSSPLQPQTDVKSFSDEHEPDADQPHIRRKRDTGSPSHSSIPSNATLQSGHFDFDRDIRYQTFSVELKKQTYLHSIQFVLLQIENDNNLSEEIRKRAYFARIGAKHLVPVDIKGDKLNNTIFLPKSRGVKSGVLIHLGSEVPYYYVDKGEDILENLKWAMPHNAHEKKHTVPKIFMGRFATYQLLSGYDILNNIRSGKSSFNANFNYNNPDPIDIVSLSAELANTIEADYKLKGQTITNKLLISRAISGAHIPDPGITAAEGEYHLEFIWDNLTPAEYLRSFSRPFSTLSGEMQLVSSSIKGETIHETERHVHQAEYIGSWVDANVGTTTSFTPEGWVLNTAQSVADISADLKEGKDPDPLAVTGLIAGCIPGEKIAVKVGKFTRIGGNVVKYGVQLGNKVVDLAIVGRSIKTAVDTGEPLAIYRVFLASGMSAENSYRMTKGMSSKLKISKTVEDSAQQGKTLQNAGGRWETPKNVESISLDRSPQDESLENVQEDLLYAGPSGRCQGGFGLTTEHNIKLNKLTRLALKLKFSGARIQSFNHNSSKFKASDNFTLVHTDTSAKKINKRISSETRTASITDMESKTDELINMLKDYKGDEKEAIHNNMAIIKTAIEDIKGNINNPEKDIESDTYMLVGKVSNPEDIKNHYGLVEVLFSLNNNNLFISNLFAHPYVVINKYPAFRDSLIEKEVISRSEFERYNIKNVAKYLGSKSVKSEIDYFESFPSLKVKTFSFNGVNPITQRLGYKLESISNYLSNKRHTNNLDSVDESDELLTSKNDMVPLQENINYLKANVRKNFTPIKPISEFLDKKTEEVIGKIMKDAGAEIISNDITDSRNGSDEEIRNFSLEVITAVNRSYEKISSVKSLFESAESQPEIKAELKALLNEATGLNDEVIIDIDQVDASDISDMVYKRFKYNVNTLHGFISKQIAENYNSFVLFKYHQFESSKPDAYALPYDSKKRILLAMLPENQRHGGLVDTVTHEASHNASYTLDHTYIGNVRSVTGSFPSSFDFASRDSRHFYENDRVSKLSSKYALGLPENVEPTQEQQTLANILLQNSKLIKSDTLLNAAEYNSYMIDVLSRAKIKDSHINFEESASRSKRSASGINHERDNIVMLALLKVALPSGSSVVTRNEHDQESTQQGIQSGSGDNNGQLAIAGMIPPVSKAEKDLQAFIELAKKYPKNSYTGPYIPSAGDFKKKAGESIYVSSTGRKYMYINNEYFHFNYGHGDSLDKDPKYKARIGTIKIGSKYYKIYRKTWLWSINPF